jgi:hypothetical protein
MTASTAVNLQSTPAIDPEKPSLLEPGLAVGAVPTVRMEVVLQPRDTLFFI